MPEVNVCITVQGENVLLFISSRFNFIHWEAILIDNIENIDMHVYQGTLLKNKDHMLLITPLVSSNSPS
jgi:hypothetical protein